MTQKYAIVPVSSISDNIATIDVPVSHAGQQAITQVKVPCPNNGGLTADQIKTMAESAFIGWLDIYDDSVTVREHFRRAMVIAVKSVGFGVEGE